MKAQEADLKRRAAEVRAKEARMDLELMVRKHPDAAEKALSCLEDLGYEINHQDSPMKKSRQSTASALRRGTSSTNLDAWSEVTVGAPPKDVVPSRSRNLAACTVYVIRDRFFGSHELTSLCKADFERIREACRQAWRR